MGDSLLEALESDLKGEDVGKYVSALFRAEEAFRKELEGYDKGKKPVKNGKDDDIASVVSSIVSGAFFKQLPLKYRVALKLPWRYAVDMLSGFLKELGSGSAEDVVTNIAKTYLGDLVKSE